MRQEVSDQVRPSALVLILISLSALAYWIATELALHGYGYSSGWIMWIVPAINWLLLVASLNLLLRFRPAYHALPLLLAAVAGYLLAIGVAAWLFERRLYILETGIGIAIWWHLLRGQSQVEGNDDPGSSEQPNCRRSGFRDPSSQRCVPIRGGWPGLQPVR
jgi:hypothetical protein